MKRHIRNEDSIFGMANLNPQKSGLPVVIWADHAGVQRYVSHNNIPRVKIGIDDHWVSVSISADPKILAQSNNIPANIMSKIQEGIEYVKRNYDVFLKHYMDTDFSFDDEDLFNELRDRKQYK